MSSEIGTPEVRLRTRYGRNLYLFCAIVVTAVLLAGYVGTTLHRTYLNTQLFQSVESSDVGGVERALALGANPNSREAITDINASLLQKIVATFSQHEKRQANPTSLMVALDLSRLMSETDVTARDRTDRIVTDLLDKGANANLVGGYDTYVMPVLIHAVAANRYECVSLLLAHGANPNQEGPSGSTALEFVRDVRTAKLLVKYGADFRHRNADGSTVLASIKQGPYAHDLLNYLVGIGAPE